MWITGNKNDQANVKDLLFNELYNECRLAAPGAKLSYSCRSKLERLSREDRKELVSRLKEGCTPLFVSCKKGNVDIVDYLIEECGADVEQKGVYEVPDDRSIHYVTPLWCASVAGKLSVVKCLVKRGADVNSVSDTGSTPVRSACFMTHLEIVKFLVESGANIIKANYNGGTCLINSVQSVPLCEFLLQHGAQVNAQDIQLKTALHYAIQEHRFETTKLLLQYGADPMIKSRYGDDALQTACLKVATQIFDYLIENFPYSPERIADAYELLGSTFLDEHYDIQTALSYWRKALDIRYNLLHQNQHQSLTKEFDVPMASTSSPPSDSYHNLAAHISSLINSSTSPRSVGYPIPFTFYTQEEITSRAGKSSASYSSSGRPDDRCNNNNSHIHNNNSTNNNNNNNRQNDDSGLGSPCCDEACSENSTFVSSSVNNSNSSSYFRSLIKKNLVPPKAAYNYAVEFTTYEELDSLALDLDLMRIQSLLICERILGTAHKDMIFRLMYRGAAYADSLQYQRCIDLWIYALELRIAKDTILHSEACFAAQALVRLFLDLQEKHAARLLREELQFTDVYSTVQLIFNQLPSAIEALSVRPVFKKQQDNFDKVLKVSVTVSFLFIYLHPDVFSILLLLPSSSSTDLFE